MNMTNPLLISIFIAILLQIGIIPWAAWQGTLNWQTGPLYLFFTIPAAVVIMFIGVVLTIIRSRAG